MEQITLTKEECVEQCINKDLKLLDYRVQQILEGVSYQKVPHTVMQEIN